MPNNPVKYDRVRASLDNITHRLSLIRALYIVSVANNTNHEAVLKEFHQAVGDVLEGMALKNLDLTHLDRDKVREEVSWLRQHK